MRSVLDKLIQFLITIIMAIMVIAVCWQVFTRYVLKNPSTVTEEALRYLLIWTTMVGAAYAYGRRKHLSINILSKKLSERYRHLLDLFIQVIVIGFCLSVMIKGGLNLLKTAQGMSSAAIGIPMQYIYSSMLVGAILFIFYAIIFIVEDIRLFKSEGKKVQGEKE